MLVSLALLAVLVALVGLAFAGSTARIADGVEIAGVEVGGLTPTQARTLLEQRFDRVARVPVVFTAGGERYPIKATSLSVEADWAAAIETAAREGEGFGPVRGFRRLQARFFGAEIAPPVQAYGAALDFKLAGLAEAIDRPHVEAKLVRRGLAIEVVPGQAGRRLDQEVAGGRIVRALARLERGQPVALPVRIDPIEVTSRRPGSRRPSGPHRPLGARPPQLRRHALEAAALADRRAPVAAGQRGDAGRDRRARARKPGSPSCARRWSARRSTRAFEPAGDGVQIVPAKDGLAVDVPATATALLAAVTSADNRTAELVVRTAPADRTTADAQAMGIERRLASYTTLYAGTSDRITNLQLAISLLNGALVAPGATFSFNERVGERTIERGFRPAPVIIKDEYDEAVGGGVSQVATTVFNAAWEAGLKIAERAPHSLYISRYQTGRDATVNYPDLDLKFVNDTPNWILVAGASGDSGITVSLYGGGPERRVESGEASLRVTGPAPIRRVKDPELLKGKTTVEEEGSPARATSRHPDGLRRGRRRPARRDLEHVLPGRVPDHPRRHEAEAQAKPPPKTKDETPPAEPTPGAETPTAGPTPRP